MLLISLCIPIICRIYLVFYNTFIVFANLYRKLKNCSFSL